MFSFALKNLAIKKVQVILVILSIVLSAGVGVLAYNIGEQVSDGITGNSGYYSAIIGPSGSKSQLAMNTMYFADEPLGTIPYSVVSDLQRDSRVNLVIPFSMADSYSGYSCVGTTPAYLDNKTVADGRMFDESATFEVVLGATVARTCGLKVGDVIYTSHGTGEEHHTPLTVVGILEQSHSSFDNIIFTEFRTIWDVHGHEEGEEEDHDHDHEEGEHEHDHETNMVCAILIKTTNPATAMTVVNDYNGRIVTDEDGDSFTLQAIEPMDAVRGVLQDADSTKYIVFALCAIIMVMNIMIISVITLLNMYHSAKEISLMRLIGIGMNKINLLYIIQNALIGLVSVVLAFGLSRLCLLAAGGYVEKMGVVLNLGKIYPAEIVILAAIFVISILPTAICTLSMSKKDGINE